MKKYVLTTDGSEVVLSKSCKVAGYTDIMGYLEFKTNCLTEKQLKFLINLGFIKEVKSKKVKDIPTELSYYIYKVGTKLGLTTEYTCKMFFNSLIKYSPSTAFILLLKQLAFEIDKLYPDYISNSERIFGVSNVDGNIYEIPKSSIKSYKNFAAFRTVEDADLAMKILSPIYKRMFSSKEDVNAKDLAN